ncbi:ubiquitin carboxyl-terminal hydrolase 14, partial [Tanacetum coccineum]
MVRSGPSRPGPDWPPAPPEDRIGPKCQTEIRSVQSGRSDPYAQPYSKAWSLRSKSSAGEASTTAAAAPKDLMLPVVISYVNVAIDTTAIGFKKEVSHVCIFTLTACTLGLGLGCIFTMTAIAKWECSSYGRALTLHARGMGTAGLNSFPDYLVLHMRQFVMETGWVPKKLDVYIYVDDVIDISHMRSKGLQPGEELLPEE